MNCQGQDMDRQMSRKYKVEKEENIYSELVFEDDLIQGGYNSPFSEIEDHCEKPAINMTTKESRMDVLETLPANYVIYVPKNSRIDTEGIIACTLVPREMLTDMVSFDRSKKEQLKNKQGIEKDKNSNHDETELLAGNQVHANDQYEVIANSDNESKENKFSTVRSNLDLKPVEYINRERRYTKPVQDCTEVENIKVRS